jgi:rhomboid-like protein
MNPNLKAIYGLMGVNLAVFGLWQIPAFYRHMYTWFMHGVADRSVLPMLLSCFSHMGIAHLAFNMIAFNSFGTNVAQLMGTEQTLALYIAGGVFSSYCSHLALLWRGNITRSLGASGAIYAFVAASSILVPDARLSLIFFPFISFSSGVLLPCLFAFELLGLSVMLTRGRGFMGFDHAAHLGGALFGISYMKFLESQGRIKQYKNYKKVV